MSQAQDSTDQTTGAVQKLGQTYQATKEKVRGKFFEYDRASLATLAASTAAAALYQKQLQTLSATSAVTGQSMGTLRRSIDNTFKSLPIARGDLVQLATTINQLGISSNRDIGQMVNIFTKLAAATGGSSSALAGSMIAFTRAMGDTSVGNVKAMSNSLADLAAREHLAAESISSFANAIAPIARVAGVTENQVLGLATAFSKAGQDGFVAANTFNTMLEEVTQLASTGSPQLAKYANLLGLTVQQFNNLPRAQAISQLFQAINAQGSRGIATLDQLGINGVRAIRSVQAVVSEGDLNTLASGGSTTNGAMDKGASASFNNLADSLAVSRNEMVQYGTVIGNQLIGPLTGVVKIVNSLIRSLGFLQPLLALPIAAMGVLGTAVAPVLTAAAPFVAMRWLRASPLGRGARFGFGEGRRAGSPEEQALYRAEQDTRLTALNAVRAGQRDRLIARGMTEEEAMRRVPVMTNDYDKMGPIQRFGMRTGSYLGSRLSMVTPQAGTDQALYLRGLRNYALTAPMRVGSWIASANTDWYRNSMGAGGPLSMRSGAAGFEAPAADAFFRRMSGQGIKGTLSRFQARMGAFSTEGAGLSSEEQKIAAGVKTGSISTESSKFQSALRGMVAKSEAEIGKINERIKAEGASASTSRALSREFGILTRNVAQLSGATVKASGSVFLAGARALPGSSVVRGAASAVGRFGWGLTKDLFGSPLGGLMTAGMLGYGGYQLSQSHNKYQENLLTNDLNPIQKYNEQLGIASTNLANFSMGLQQASDQSKSFQPTSYAQISQSMKTMAAEAPSTPLNKIWSAISDMQGGNWSRTALNTLRQMPISDPRQLSAVVQDMLASGKSQTDVQTVLQQYMAAGGPNKVTGLGRGVSYAQTGREVLGTEGLGFAGRDLSNAKHLAYYSTIGLGKNIAKSISGWFGGGGGAEWSYIPKGNQSERGAAQIGTAMSALQSQYQIELQTQGASYATAQRLQSGLSLFAPLLRTARNDAAQGKDSQRGGATREALARGLSLLVTGSTKGSGYSQIMDVIGNHKGQKKAGLNLVGGDITSQEQGIMNVLGQTGKGKEWLNRQAQAIGLSDWKQLDPTQFRTMMINAQNNVGGMGGDFQKFLGQQGNLGKVAAHSGVVQQAIGAMAGDPSTQFRAQQRLIEASVRQSGSLTKASGALDDLAVKVGGSSTAMGQLALAAKSTVDRLQELKLPQMSRLGQIGVRTSQYKEAYQNRLNNQEGYTTAQGTYQQESDAQAQHLQQMFTQVRDYDTQRGREQYDFNLQVSRSRAAFNLQEQYAQDDFQKQMARSKRDYQRSLDYQARGAAQSIYDPYTRIQAKPTSSAGTLLANLADQNQAIQRQTVELRALNKMGLSKEAIQTLNLADPNNAQQLDRLFLQARDDPSIIIQLNAMTAKRLTLTKGLTQNNFNLQFQQTNQQFTQGLRDATKDYNTARDRAVAAQHLALFQMSQDYTSMVNRSAADLKTSMTELSNNLGTNFGNVMNLVTGKLSKYAPAAAEEIKKQLDKLKKQFPELFDPNFVGQVSEKGTKHGGVVMNKTGTSASQPYGPPAKPRKSPPPQPHASGGISTYEHLAYISEGGLNEAIIPLNSRGQAFMAGMYQAVSQQIIKQQSASVYGGTTTSKTYVDNSTNITGPITVNANDTKKMMDELARKQRLSRLTKPAHSGA